MRRDNGFADRSWVYSMNEERAARWWDGFETWNGVFQGGGAKGVAYVGALEAFAEVELWFHAVAGASAGAFTAALIAAGYHPDVLRREAPSLLADVAPAGFFNWVTGRLSAVLGHYVLAAVEENLDKLLRDSPFVGPLIQGAAPVTFLDLYSATSIELDILALDASVGQPQLFNVHWTPNLGVAKAVVASASIPLLFNPVFATPDATFITSAGQLGRRRAVFPMLLDGGVWANFPTFVFRDQAFRRYHLTPPVSNAERTIGFVLEREDELPKVLAPPEKFVSLTHLDRRILKKASATENSLPLRFAVLLVELWLLASLWVIAVEARSLIQLFWEETAMRIGTGAIAAFLLFLLWGTHRLIHRRFLWSGVPAARSLMGLATGVPAWAGAVEGDLVVRVPAGRLETHHFNAPLREVTEVIEKAKQETRQQLRHILMEGETLWARQVAGLREGRTRYLEQHASARKSASTSVPPRLD